MHDRLRSLLPVAALCILSASAARGGAIVAFGDGDFEGVQDFLLRRARFRLRATLDDRLTCFMQTALNGVIEGKGRSMRASGRILRPTSWRRSRSSLCSAMAEGQDPGLGASRGRICLRPPVWPRRWLHRSQARG